jgi:multiple sugar transport system permease protein
MPLRSIPRRQRPAIVLLIPVTVLAVALSLYPIGDSIYLGFTNYRIGGTFGLVPLRFLGLTNFELIWQDSDFTSGLGTILAVGALVVSITYILGYLLALLLNRRIPFRRLLRTIVLLPMAIPPLVGGQVWKYLYDPSSGAINGLLLQWHLESQAQYLPLASGWGIFWIGIVGVWLSLPFVTLLVLAALQGVSAALYEAAEIDGAGRLSRFWFVTVPGTQSTLAAIIPLSFAGQLLAFDAYYVLSGSGSGGNTAGALFMIPTIYAYFDLSSGLLGRAAAVGDMLLVLILVAFFISRYLNSRDR